MNNIFSPPLIWSSDEFPAHFWFGHFRTIVHFIIQCLFILIIRPYRYCYINCSYDKPTTCKDIWPDELRKLHARWTFYYSEKNLTHKEFFLKYLCSFLSSQWISNTLLLYSYTNRHWLENETNLNWVQKIENVE